MSSPHCNNDVALPHAGLLAYFHQPNGANSCDKSARTTRDTSAIWSDKKHRLLDEEGQYDFGDADSMTDSGCGYQCRPEPRRYVFHSLYDFWIFVCIVSLASCAVLLGLDTALSHFGMGMGLTEGIMGRQLPPPTVAHEVSGRLDVVRAS